MHLIPQKHRKHLGETSIVLETTTSDGVDERQTICIVPILHARNHVGEHDERARVADAVAFIVGIEQFIGIRRDKVNATSVNASLLCPAPNVIVKFIILTSIYLYIGRHIS